MLLEMFLLRFWVNAVLIVEEERHGLVVERGRSGRLVVEEEKRSLVVEEEKHSLVVEREKHGRLVVERERHGRLVVEEERLSLSCESGRKQGKGASGSREKGLFRLIVRILCTIQWRFGVPAYFKYAGTCKRYRLHPKDRSHIFLPQKPGHKHRPAQPYTISPAQPYMILPLLISNCPLCPPIILSAYPHLILSSCPVSRPLRHSSSRPLLIFGPPHLRLSSCPAFHPPPLVVISAFISSKSAKAEHPSINLLYRREGVRSSLPN